MNTYEKPIHFFLGANTPQGFVSRFDQLADVNNGWREFIIKGGPGTGKSTLMHQIADTLEDSGPMELIHCSSDADSLDGVILHALKFAVADGTSPHVIEPRYPGAFEQLVDLSGCWDAHKLFEKRTQIMLLSVQISRCHEHSCRFLAAAGSLIGDTYRIALDATESAKALKAAARIAQAEFKPCCDMRGRESVRFLSAVTNKGFTLFDDTVRILCKRLYRIEDSYGAASRILLSTLREAALDAGYDVISCFCPLSPFEKLEHLFIPALSLGFTTANDYHTVAMEPYKIVRARRFTDTEKLKKSRKRIAFNKKASAQMLSQASKLLAEAKKLHDQLETFYIDAMDFEKVNAVKDRLLMECLRYKEGRSADLEEDIPF